MPGLSELLRDAVGEIETDATVSGLVTRARTRRARRHARRVGAGVAATLLLVAAAVFTLARRDSGSNKVRIPSGHGVFSETTNAVLLFDNGYDGVTYVDLDHQLAVRHAIAGQRAGDQSVRLARVGDRLVVGWGDIYTTPIGIGPSTPLGSATVFLPAAEPGSVWMVDYPGGRIGEGTPTVRNVDTSGRIFFDTTGPTRSVGLPALGIPGGLALETPTGLVLWDAATQAITGHLGRALSHALDVRQNVLAWCDGDCTSLHIATLGKATTDTVYAAGEGIVAAKLSSDGTHVAFVSSPSPGGGRGSIHVVDITTGTNVTVTDASQPYRNLGWSPDGQELFFASNSYQQDFLNDRTLLGRYSVASGKTEQAALPFAGLMGFVVATNVEVGQLPAPNNGCPPPAFRPNGATDCAFAFASS